MKMHVLNRQLNMFEVIEYEKKATLNESTVFEESSFSFT